MLQDPGVNCSLGDAFFPQRRGGSRGCRSVLQGVQGWGWKAGRMNKISSAHSEFEERQELVLDFQGDLGSSGCFGSPSPNPSL